MEGNNRELIISNITVYSITHALVDSACAAVVFNCAFNGVEKEYLIFLVILYNFLAFGLQPILGFMTDKLRLPAEAAIIGCVLVAVSAAFHNVSLLAVCLAGIGNAFFHVGGGVISLNLVPGKATLPGIYVAPGALGLFVGTFAGKNGSFSPWLFMCLLLAAAIIIFMLDKPFVCYETYTLRGKYEIEYVILLIFSTITIRGLVGFMLNYSWKSNIYLLIIFTIAIVLGKAFGGILADRYGWIRVAITGLIVSAPLLALGYKSFIFGILGVLLFNLTMPVTLVAISYMLPGQSGFAFGLTTLALLIGVFPTFTPLREVLYSNNSLLILVIVLIMAYILYKGLKIILQINISRPENKKIQL